MWIETKVTKETWQALKSAMPTTNQDDKDDDDRSHTHTHTHTHTPVSYTHLDVYKRQIFGAMLKFLRVKDFSGTLL